RRELDTPALILARVLTLEILRDTLQSGLGLRRPNALFQTAHDGEHERAPGRHQCRNGEGVLIGRHGDVYVRAEKLVEAVELFRSDTDNGEAVAIEPDSALRDAWVSAVNTLPQTVADDGNVGPGATGIFLRQECSAGRGAYAESIEVVARNEVGHDQPRVAAPGERDGYRDVEHQRTEDGVLVAELAVIRVRGEKEVRIALIHREHRDEGTWIVHGEFAQEQ